LDQLDPAADLKALPAPLRDERFAAVGKLLGRFYDVFDETPVPDEFTSEAWWILRGLSQ
jgi:hypothetical protein